MPATPSFEEMFGVGKVPIASYFNLPKGASADTQFSPQARELLSQGEDYAREQAAREAEIAAEELLGGAANMSDDQLQQQLVQNPRLFGTRAIQPLSGYVQYRQSTSPMSDEVLGPVIEAKITDPYHKERFRNRMLDEGLSANDAYDAYLTDEYNNKFEVALAEAGVPETEYAKLRTASGKFDPVAVPRAVAAAKAAAKLSGTGKKAEPIDIRIETLKEALEERKKRLEARGEDLTKDERYQKLADELDTVYDEKLVGVRPPPPKPVDDLLSKYSVSEALKGQAPVKATLDSPPVFDVTISPEENKARMKQYKRGSEERAAKQKVEDSIAQTWTKKKLEIVDKLEPFYKTPDELRAVANSIVSGRSSPEAAKTPYQGVNLYAGGVGKPEPYVDYIAKKLGLKPEGVAFREPESASWNRVGTQNVANRELLVSWAESFLAADKAAQEAAQRQQVQEPSNSGIAEDPEMAKLLDTYAPKK